jgi:acylaminoacyl-peptidase
MHKHEITSDDSRDLGAPDEEPFVPIVDNPELDGFPGLYSAYNLPKSASIQGPGLSYILLHSHWGSRTTVVRVPLEDDGYGENRGHVKDLTPADEDLYSWSVLTTNGSDSVICSRSSPSVPYEIMLGKFDPNGEVTWTLLEKPQLPGSGMFFSLFNHPNGYIDEGC